MAYLTSAQLEAFGFRSLGKNVRVSDRASIYGAQNISIGDFSRVDDFCVISAGEGGISIGSYVHIAVGCCLIGSEAIVLEDFVGISSRSAVYSSSDDYSGGALTGPTVPKELTNVTHSPVRFGRHTIVGAGSVVLPGVTTGQGVAVGALSLLRRDCPEFTIWSGAPARQIGVRKRALLEKERTLLGTGPSAD